MISEDTIVAISTPPGNGAIAILRVSGPRAIHITASILKNPTRFLQAPSRVQKLVSVMDGDSRLDQALSSIHRAPESYTGEDVVEIACHGGQLVTRQVFELLLLAGARGAGPGEFTQRAFLNGKMDLTQAEAVMDLIQAESVLALRSANDQLEGLLGKQIAELRDRLLALLAHLEAWIDFPDEDIDPETGEVFRAKTAAALAEVSRLLATANRGRILREGVRTVICGEPNVGKSSLLNRLTGLDRAIVSHLPGTTRDTIEESIQIGGYSLRLTDTAGFREAVDMIEKEGIARTHRVLDRADLVLEVFDASLPTPAHVRNGKNVITVLNKCDLGQHTSWTRVPEAVLVSCETGAGVEMLSDAIIEKITGGEIDSQAPAVAINARHKVCLEKSRVALEKTLEALSAGLAPEFVSIDLREALDALGEIIGRLDTDDLLGEIFSTFCIGK